MIKNQIPDREPEKRLPRPRKAAENYPFPVGELVRKNNNTYLVRGSTIGLSKLKMFNDYPLESTSGVNSRVNSKTVYLSCSV